MKLALIGNGSMGQLVTSLARDAGHEIGTVLASRDANRTIDDLAAQLSSHDAAIDFSVSGAALRNIEACAAARVPLVEGTTGWQNEEPRMRQIIAEHDGALIYGANFSVGANLFYRVVEHAAALFAVAPEYSPFIEEGHHVRKRDAPSGTALRLRDLLKQQLKTEIPIASTRAGHIPGTHRVGFDSPADQITLTHTARSRQGFASGALVAAQWIVGRKGVYEFSEVIDELVGGRKG
jgi:4-hydroxy-tetrahydrodipicolinate reductase